MEPPGDAAGPSDVRLCGYLRKQRSQRRRFFVLRGASERGPARLEYYENEKKFRAGGGSGSGGRPPKRTFPLASALSISKRADARHRHLVVLSARHGTWGLAAESAEQQQLWFAALVELHGKGKEAAWEEGRPGAVAPVPAFKEVWQVTLRPRGLGHSKNLAGTYLLCLAEKTISFVRLHSEVVAVALQLLNVRRCGHSENYFFMEVGRSAVTGPGELWMQVEDLVVAQNMHETILEAMKALSEDFRLRGQSQPLPSSPISKAPPGARKADSLSDYSALSSDEGGSSPGESRHGCTPDPLRYLVEEGEMDYIAMAKLASPDRHRLNTWTSATEAKKRASLPPLALEKDALQLPRREQGLRMGAASASYPEGLNLRGPDPGYMAMLPGVAVGTQDQDYVPMTPGSLSPPRREQGGYMVMSPTGSCSPEGQIRSRGGEYMNMSPVSRSASSTPPEYGSVLALPGSAPFCSLPRSYKRDPRPLALPFNPGRLSCSSSTSSESLEEPPGGTPTHPHLLLAFPRERIPGDRPSAPRSTGEYVSIQYQARAADYVNMELRGTLAEHSRTAVPKSCDEMATGARLVRTRTPGRRPPSAETFPEGERNGALPCETQMESGLNYIDLDLGKEVTPGTPSALPPYPGPGLVGRLHSYASIDFDRSGELWGYKAGSEGDES
ncbi:hypothetical protein JRQ81_004594 [Phrynocephalus forsythii]|uniref:Insulin receptor substrate 1 n=1 Tax=Phrynocephalus forsythii TaxID=171643 RepID=A0A9Q1AUQ2_9SAUR|nr:hypothetical protein JRQ81_004594 [Phrynocephalus forsythii]